MPRVLPWLTEGKNTSKSAQTPSSPAPAKRDRESRPEDLVDSNLNTLAAETSPGRGCAKKRTAASRTPSTSPPPAPPDVEYMREGYAADDSYIMVEDEFFSTAKMFTQHLHHAEYVRFKKLAAARGAGVLEGLTRPVDERTERSRGLELSLEADEKMEKIKAAFEEAKGKTGESSDEEDDFMQDAQLAGLMTGGTGLSRNLTGMAKTKSNTRAAAGLLQSPRNIERAQNIKIEKPVDKPLSMLSKAKESFEEEDFSDDLDSVRVVRKRNAEVKVEKRQNDLGDLRGSTVGSNTPAKSKDENIFKRFAEPLNKGRSRNDGGENEVVLGAGSRCTDETIFDTTIRSPGKDSAKGVDYLAKRRNDREKKEREEKRKAKSTIDVPTFII